LPLPLIPRRLLHHHREFIASKPTKKNDDSIIQLPLPLPLIQAIATVVAVAEGDY